MDNDRSQLNTPVLFLVFNRPEPTARVFEEIRKARPKRLFIAADGPRVDKQGESEKCEKVRQVATAIDWPCEVKTLFRDKNLGCKTAVSSAITWFFENVEEGIILEDDCLPDQSFFPFCEELLLRFRQDERVMMVSGYNFSETWNTPYSYLFSKYGSIWGWATWRRAWREYDVEMRTWINPETKKIIENRVANRRHFKIMRHIFDRVSIGKVNTWDYQWVFAILKNFGLTIVPSSNLISNIGFGTEATHTTKFIQPKKTFIIAPPFLDPKTNEPDKKFDNRLFSANHGKMSLKRLAEKFTNKFKSLFHLFVQTPNTRWQDLEYFDESWKNRIEIMTKLLENEKSVLDLGCGKMWLKGFLPKDVRYYGADYKLRDTDTIVCDLNKGQFPDVRTDLAFMSGILEYIEYPAPLIKKINSHCDKVILSYCTTDLTPDIRTRRHRAWVNDFSSNEIVELFEKNGFRLERKLPPLSANEIFKFTKITKK